MAFIQAVPPAQHSQLAYLSGPSFAAEVAEGKPTGLTIAARVRAVGAAVEALVCLQLDMCHGTGTQLIDVLQTRLHHMFGGCSFVECQALYSGLYYCMILQQQQSG
eukprot:GHUV01035430.1.p1 GENE.GHUV01035430.1~~GHUV01035430.1.p1  ORF type:complete len:106 (-),score=18.88 GHUV01035430.1:90-407(-)